MLRLPALVVCSVFVLTVGTAKAQVTAFDATDADAVAAAVSVTFDPHQALRTLSGPVAMDRRGEVSGIYHLRGWRVGDGDVDGVQIYLVNVVDNGWAFFNRAHKDGRMLDLIEIGREVMGCSHGACMVTETFGIDLTLEDLREAAQAGFAFGLYGQRLSVHYELPATYFEGYLRVIDAERGQSAITATGD